MSLHRLAFCGKIPALLQPVYRTTRCPNNFLQVKNISQTPHVRHPFKGSKAIVEEILADSQNIHMKPSSLLKPFVFTVGIAISSFVGVTIWEYEEYRAKMTRAIKAPLGRLRDSFQQQTNNAISDLKRAWAKLSPGDRFFIPMCALNLLVFGLWRVPRMQVIMFKYFCANPAAKSTCLPMLLSTFSHYSIFHIFCNMYVLQSFSNAICTSLGKEQLLGFYLTAGVVASLLSYAHKTFVGVAGFSLGASGAIMGVLGYVCLKYPDTTLSIMFLPMFTFSAGTAIKFVMGVDILGCLLGWKYFDHAAHLGGALFGMFWCYFGAQEIWPKRKFILEKWHNLRSS